MPGLDRLGSRKFLRQTCSFATLWEDIGHWVSLQLQKWKLQMPKLTRYSEICEWELWNTHSLPRIFVWGVICQLLQLIYRITKRQRNKSAEKAKMITILGHIFEIWLVHNTFQCFHHTLYSQIAPYFQTFNWKFCWYKSTLHNLLLTNMKFFATLTGMSWTCWQNTFWLTWLIFTALQCNSNS